MRRCHTKIRNILQVAVLSLCLGAPLSVGNNATAATGPIGSQGDKETLSDAVDFVSQHVVTSSWTPKIDEAIEISRRMPQRASIYREYLDKYRIVVDGNVWVDYRNKRTKLDRVIFEQQLLGGQDLSVQLSGRALPAPAGGKNIEFQLRTGSTWQTIYSGIVLPSPGQQNKLFAVGHEWGRFIGDQSPFADMRASDIISHYASVYGYQTDIESTTNILPQVIRQWDDWSAMTGLSRLSHSSITVSTNQIAMSPFSGPTESFAAIQKNWQQMRDSDVVAELSQEQARQTEIDATPQVLNNIAQEQPNEDFLYSRSLISGFSYFLRGNTAHYTAANGFTQNPERNVNENRTYAQFVQDLQQQCGLSGVDGLDQPKLQSASRHRHRYTRYESLVEHLWKEGYRLRQARNKLKVSRVRPGYHNDDVVTDRLVISYNRTAFSISASHSDSCQQLANPMNAPGLSIRIGVPGRSISKATVIPSAASDTLVSSAVMNRIYRKLRTFDKLTKRALGQLRLQNADPIAFRMNMAKNYRHSIALKFALDPQSEAKLDREISKLKAIAKPATKRSMKRRRP